MKISGLSVVTRGESHSKSEVKEAFETYAWRRFSEKLDKSIEDKRNRLESAKTPYEIAIMQGAIMAMREIRTFPGKIIEEMDKL